MQKPPASAVSSSERGPLPAFAKPLMPDEQSSGYIADKLVKAEKRIKAFPYDTEAWSILIRDAQIRKIEDARVVYERLVEQFPNAGKYWKIYIEHEVSLLLIQLVLLVSLIQHITPKLFIYFSRSMTFRMGLIKLLLDEDNDENFPI